MILISLSIDESDVNPWIYLLFLLISKSSSYVSFASWIGKPGSIVAGQLRARSKREMNWRGGNQSAVVVNTIERSYKFTEQEALRQENI